MRIAGVVGAALLVVSGLAQAAAPLDECDRRAANPPDPDRITIGIERKDIDLPKAIAACKAAVAAHPDVARFSYQLGRVLFYDNQVAPALVSFQRAADLDYRQAKFMMGMLMTRKYDGVSQDDCKVVQYWVAASEQHHANAEVSLVRDTLHGRFRNCPGVPTKEKMRAYLKDAKPQVDYLGGFLVEDLQVQLDAR